jgi:chorismate mutase
MPSDEPTDLKLLRREIDEIDTTIHDLLMRRSVVAAEIAGSEPDLALPIRPAREAALLRRLIDRHEGDLPLVTVFRIWREMVVGCAAHQKPITVAVSTEDANDPLWDLARDHFGGAVTYLTTGQPSQTLRELANGNATIGVLPWPASEPAEPWWLPLMTRDEQPLHVIAVLPAMASGNMTEDVGLVVARHRHSKTGIDRTLLAIELAADVSRSRLRERLEGADLAPVRSWSWGLQSRLPGTMHLFEIDGYIYAEDERLQKLAASLGSDLIRAQSIGGFAVPVRQQRTSI